MGKFLIKKVPTGFKFDLKDKFGDRYKHVEIKLFPGLKVTSKYILPEQSKSNLDISKNSFVLSLSATFSNYFREKIRDIHKQYE